MDIHRRAGRSAGVIGGYIGIVSLAEGPKHAVEVFITHSVDLIFDLAKLAELKTDTGGTLLPVKWDAPSGGHHVEGVLSFPAKVDRVC